MRFAASLVRTTLAVLALVSVPVATAAQPYTIVDLGVLPGQTSMYAHGLNNALQVVGETDSGQAFLWEPTGLRALGVVTGQEGRLQINNSGVIAGVRIVDGRRQPFAWINGASYELQSPPGELRSMTDLSDNGLLLMHTGPRFGQKRSWLLWGQNLYDVDAVVGTAYAINESGILGGIAASRPFLRFPDGRITTPWQTSIPVRLIGPGGHFAGFTETTVFQSEWYYATPDGTVTRFEPFGTGVTMSLGGMNRAGDMVGHFHRHGAIYTPFLYRNGRIIDLNSVVPPSAWRLMVGVGINDSGYIVAWATPAAEPFSMWRSVLLVPAAPAAPSGLTHTLNGRVVTLTWQESVGALDYIIEAGTAPGAGNVVTVNVGAQRSVTTPAPPGRYFVRVRARNAIGISGPSNEVVIDVP